MKQTGAEKSAPVFIVSIPGSIPIQLLNPNQKPPICSALHRKPQADFCPPNSERPNPAIGNQPGGLRLAESGERPILFA